MRDAFADLLAESRKVRRALEAALYAFAVLAGVLSLATLINVMKALF